MRRFAEYHPVVTALYFLLTAGVAAFSMQPVLMAMSLCGALIYSFLTVRKHRARRYLIYALIFLILTLVNPIFSHNGVTVLFYVNDRAVTFEAIFFGLIAAGTATAVLCHFASFTEIVTKDKLLCLTSTFAPKFALVLSMAFRFIPLYASQARRVRDAQKAVGLYKDGNIVDRIRGGTRVFSILTTWGLEKGIVTADAMTARGYGTGRRTNYRRERFRSSDGTVLTVILLLFVLTILCAALGGFRTTYYPEIALPHSSTPTLAGYICYGLLCILPLLIDMKEWIKWKYLLSKT